MVLQNVAFFRVLRFHIGCSGISGGPVVDFLIKPSGKK
jgi:hypothetical protein